MRTDDSGKHLIFFDGSCGFCNQAVQRIMRLDKKRVFCFASLENRELVTHFLGSDWQENSFAVIPEFRRLSRVLTYEQAVFFVAEQLGWPWRLIGIFRIFPSRILKWVYQLIARNRYRLGGVGQCSVPSPEDRKRLIHHLKMLEVQK